MADSKVQLTIGDISLSAEGDAKWIDFQIDMIIKVATANQASHHHHQPTPRKKGNGSSQIDPKPTGKNLPAFLRDKNATKSQVRKFLATSIWLHENKNKQRLKTGDVAKALAESKQTRLGNPSDALNQNVSKGHCEKDGSEFFVTDEGRKEIGVLDDASNN